MPAFFCSQITYSALNANFFAPGFLEYVFCPGLAFGKYLVLVLGLPKLGPFLSDDLP